MAAIPTYFYFGDVMITGGAQPDTQLPTFWGQYLNNPRFARVKPSSPNGVTPPVAPFNFLPYWDGQINSGAGGFVPFYYIAGLIPPDGHGDNWFLTPGGGITPMPLIVEELWQRHFQDPGFKVLKFAQSSAGWSAWKPGGAAWVAAMAEWTKMQAAAALDGHTLVPAGFILDCSATDILAESPTFQSDAQACITGLRGMSSTAPIIIVSHRPDFALNVPGAAKAARTFHKNLRSANPGVAVFDMNFAKFGRDGVVGGTEIGPNNLVYETADYVEAGARLGRLLVNLLTNTTLAETEGPMAVDVFIGDSNFLTFGMDATQVVLGKEESMLGPDDLTTQRVAQWIYDDANEQVVPYDVMSVTNSIGVTQEHFFGPEATYLSRLREEIPTAQRCVFKFAVGGANLGALDAVWDDVVAMWRRFLGAIVRDTGRVPDVGPINLNFGHNDGLSEFTADVFDAKVLQMIDQARELFTTRADGKPTPVNWVQNAPHQGNGWAKGTAHGEAASNERVRQTIAGLPTKRPNVRVILNGDPATKRLTFELQRGDRIHLGGQATYGIGYALADATLAAIAEDATGADQAGGGEPTQLVEAAVDTSPAGIVAILEAAIATGSDVASYTTATGQTVTLRSFSEILRALQYFEAKASRNAGIRRTRVIWS